MHDRAMKRKKKKATYHEEKRKIRVKPSIQSVKQTTHAPSIILAMPAAKVIVYLVKFDKIIA